MSKREYFTDRTGKWIGSVLTEKGGKKTYLDGKGGLLGRFSDGKTFDRKGGLLGKGDQGMRFFK